MDNLYFLYHELHPEERPYTYALDCESFRRHCELFASVLEQPGMLQPQITFDDGHRSNFELAAPILQEYGLSAHFFLTVGWIGNKADFMDWSQVRSLASSGHTIGAHGWAHKLLTHCSASDLDEELTGARATLEDRLGIPITTMSLPGGRHIRRTLDACWNAGYTEVFTSNPETAAPLRTPPAIVGRINVRNQTSVASLRSLLTPGDGALERLRRTERLKSAAKEIMGDRLYRMCWGLWNRHEESVDPADAPGR